MPATTSERAPIILPDALAPLVCARRWVVWKWIKTDKGRLTKPPFIAADPRVKASCDDAATWGDFDTAQACYKAGRADGIGFALLGSGLAAFDLDDCRDPESGALQDWAQTLATRCGSYAEITPSRCGVRIIGTANGTKLHRKFIGTAMHAIYGAPNGASLEVYRDAERFICITGMELAPAVAQLAGLDQIAEAVVAELDEAKAVGGQSKMVFDVVGKPAARPSLDEIIKHGHHELWGGDRSKGTWYVINQLIEQGRSDDNIVAVLTSPDNGISAHVLSKPEDPKKYVRRQVLKARKAKREAAASTAGRAGSAAAEGGSVDVFGVEIARLAAFSDLEYERVRKAAAERLEIRATVLDRLVTAERERMRGGPADKLAGRAISFPEPQPWPQPVDGAKLLDDVARTIRSHVLMSEHEGDVCALWILHTYLIDCFQVSPRLSIRSPVKQCGKTTLIDLLNCLVARPLSTANVSPAVVFRVVESYRPTLLIDEVDTFLHGNEELRGILNSGHRKGGTVLRVEGDGHEVRAFSTYGACAFSGIGELPETLGDRSIKPWPAAMIRAHGSRCCSRTFRPSSRTKARTRRRFHPLFLFRS